jgi:glutamate-1-semialdehyde 2,1-aminomutase
MKHKYTKSENALGEALKTIPLGAQTFSKSITQFPFGVSPYFAVKAEGSKIWDIDGNEYIDFINSLASITLGYNDPDVNLAVENQLKKGVIFSLSTELERRVAEAIVEMVPCAEMVRFGKNGSDATSGAIRLARAYTGKDYVLVCGYHGWQDWYIGSTNRDLGVPQAVKDLTLKFIYNDINSLKSKFEEFKGKIAAVILEPINIELPKDNFLEQVKEITHANGAILIFDETITGFRYSNGGAQEYFNVIPDLATFGKGLANGYPLSAVAGRKEIMKLMEDIFYSFTFGGETLSLAASLTILEKLKNENIIQRLFYIGNYLMDRLRKLISNYNLGNIFGIEGLPVWTFFTIKDTKFHSIWQLKTLYMQIMLENGILIYGTHNISYAHSESDIDCLMEVYEKYFKIVTEIESKNNILDHLKCEPLVPLFKVR